MAIAIIRRATIVSNVATFEVDGAEPYQPGQVVTVAGCTTGTFNRTYTVTAAGLIQLNPSSSTNVGENWPGFSAPFTNANIAVEIEPTSAPFATVTTSFGTSTSSPNLLFE